MSLVDGPSCNAEYAPFRKEPTMTIIEIWTITWIYAVHEPYHNPSKAYNQAVAKFVKMGLIRPDERSVTGFRTTPAGEAYVQRLMEVSCVA